MRDGPKSRIWHERCHFTWQPIYSRFLFISKLGPRNPPHPYIPWLCKLIQVINRHATNPRFQTMAKYGLILKVWQTLLVFKNGLINIALLMILQWNQPSMWIPKMALPRTFLLQQKILILLKGQDTLSIPRSSCESCHWNPKITDFKSTQRWLSHRHYFGEPAGILNHSFKINQFDNLWLYSK